LACRSAAAVPNDIGPAVIERVFRDWRIDQMAMEDIPSGTRHMPASSPGCVAHSPPGQPPPELARIAGTFR